MEQCATTETCGPPALHRKEDDDDTNPQFKVTVKVVRSSKFWFEDGNVVLQAEHTQFRLHRSILSMHSPIFRDMFACSLPENGPMVDGCPLICLSETLEDVKNFVKILYKSIKTYNRTYPVSVSLLRTMLHFGRKYEMRGLRKEAIHCLMLEFPSTLKEWTDQDFNYVIDDNDSLEGMFEILYLAYEHSIISILPALYLRICLSFNSQEIIEYFHVAAEKTPLDNRLLSNCLLGRERLHRSVSSLTLAWLYDSTTMSRSDCKTQCQKKRFWLINKLWNDDIQFSLKFALHPWKDLHFVNRELCPSCSKVAQLAYDKARIANWKQLNSYFGICDLRDELHWGESSSDSDSSQSEAVAEELIKDDTRL